jgi:hypothetical protein
MSRQTKRMLIGAAVVIAILAALSQVLPSYNYVSVSGPDGTVRVERAGFGPQSVQVETQDASVRSSSR